jgi:selenide, water dikinase
VTHGEHAVYSGMLPAWVAGEATRADLTLALRSLAGAARAVFHPEGAAALDAGRQTVRLSGGTVLDADVLSLGVGSAVQGMELPGVRDHATHVKTVAARLDGFPAPAGPGVVVGGGMAGVELALCLRAVCSDVTLVSETEEVPDGGSAELRRTVHRALLERGVRLERGRAVEVTARDLALSDGRQLPAALVLWAAGPAPHPLLAPSGLHLGPAGGVRVDAELRSTSHPDVFAAGDCADLPQAVPKSGVYSVREGPALARNVLARLGGAPLRPYRPQRRALGLLNCGDGTAILSWGEIARRGRWMRVLKERLDRSFLNRLRRAAQRTEP